jgi:hypothetical protein
MKTLAEYKFHGEAALFDILGNSIYGSAEQAVASLTIFTHPVSVQQTGNRAVFRVRRAKAGESRGQVRREEQVVLCDNASPTDTFLWANLKQKSDFTECQFNHIYAKSDDPEHYTNLANICVTPAFLSKLTDKNVIVKKLLSYRAFQLYGFSPNRESPPKPESYDALKWADPLPAVQNLRITMEARLARASKSRVAISKFHFGWLFNEWNSTS